MKRILAVAMAAISLFASAADDGSLMQVMYWQVESTKDFSGAAYASLYYATTEGGPLIFLDAKKYSYETQGSPINTTDISGLSGATFYVELLKESGEAIEGVNGYLTYAQLVTAGALDINFVGSPAPITHTGTATFAVPEPTSGLLMLLGLAGLALKRKKA